MFWAKQSASLPFLAFESEQDPIRLGPTIDGVAVKPGLANRKETVRRM